MIWYILFGAFDETMNNNEPKKKNSKLYQTGIV